MNPRADDCTPALRDDLKAYRDRELPLARRLAVGRHVNRCASCRQEVTAMEQIGNELRAGDAGALDPNLRARLLESIPDAAGQEPVSGGAREPFWRRQPLTTFGITAAAVAAWFVVAPLVSVAPANRSRDTRAFTTPPSYAPGHSSPIALPTDAAEKPGRRLAARPAAPGQAESAAGAGYPGAPVPESRQVVADEAPTAAPLPAFERKVRKEGSLTVEVAKLEDSSDAVEKMVRDAGGFIASNNLSTGENGGKYAELTTRVPVDRFEGILGRVAKLGEVKAKQVTGEDITEETGDSEQAEQVLADEARAAQEQMDATRRGTKDEWRRRQELRALRVQLAQTRARLQRLRKDAALATITVSLQEKPKPAKVEPKASGFLGDMTEAGRAAVLTFQTAARLPVVLLIWILAYAPLWIPLAIVYRFARRAQDERQAGGGGTARNV